MCVFAANLLGCVRQKMSPLWSFIFILLIVKLKGWIRAGFLKLGSLASFWVIYEASTFLQDPQLSSDF